jgi:hypothetical protein
LSLIKDDFENGDPEYGAINRHSAQGIYKGQLAIIRRYALVDLHAEKTFEILTRHEGGDVGGLNIADAGSRRVRWTLHGVSSRKLQTKFGYKGN